MGDSKRDRTWIHHLIKNGVDLSFHESGLIIESLYTLLESKQNTQYHHEWETLDLIVYENWFNVHKRTSVTDNGVPGGRLLKRTTFNFN